MANDGTIYDELMKKILGSEPASSEYKSLANELESAVQKGLDSYIPSWKRNGSVADISIVCALPASNKINETTEDYERLVYNTAARILQEYGFSFNNKDNHWYYKRE